MSSLSAPARRSVISRELGEVYPVPGQLMVLREGTLLARPFDLGARRFTGEGVALASDIVGTVPVTGCRLTPVTVLAFDRPAPTPTAA